MDKQMFWQCCQPTQTQHYKADKWQTYKYSYPFNLFGGMADLRYNCLKMLQNWHDLVEYDADIKRRWGTRGAGILQSEEIQKEAEEQVEAEKKVFDEKWQHELQYHARQKAGETGWKWADENE